METAPGPSSNSRHSPYYRHRSQRDPLPPAAALEQPLEKEEERSRADEQEALQREPEAMRESHRQFHRRAAEEASQVLTVVVNVEQTLRGADVVGVATVTPALSVALPAPNVTPPSVPAVPAFPTIQAPSVPAVPAYPSDLVPPPLPPYPFPVADAVTPTEAVSTQAPEPTPSVPSSTEPSPTLSSTFTGFNSTASSSIISTTPLPSSSRNSTSTSSSSSVRSSSSTSSRVTPTSSASTTSSTTSRASPTSSLGGGGGGGSNPQPTVAPPPEAAPTVTAADAQADDGPALGTPQVVGTVFGSLAGAAILLAMLLFLIRRHKRKQRGSLQITGDGDTDQHQPMAQSAARSSFVPPSFLNRFSGASRSTAESSGTGERSFQRVSGRKLPSAFSEGMTSEQFDRARVTLSDASFYQDDKGFYGGAGVASKDFGTGFGKEIGDASNTGAVGRDERVMPSPARTPVIHHPDDWGAKGNDGGSTLSPPRTPNNFNPFADPIPIPRGTLGRSHPSHDGSRSSRFTENV